MIMLNVIISVLGITFFAFGFLVSFKKKYFLVSLFTKMARTNAEKQNYAEQIGLISLMSGMLYIFSAIAGLVSANVVFTLCFFAICVAITASMFLHSTLKTTKA